MNLTHDELLQAIARGWCYPKNSHKEMDGDLVLAIATDITKSENEKTANLRTEISQAINRHSAENGSNTPDFILAKFLVDCLTAFDCAVVARDQWHEIRSNL